MSNSFIEQLLANFLATIIAGVLLYCFLEKKVSGNFKRNETRRLLKNLAGDLGYNYISAGKVLEKRAEYQNEDRFTLSKYHTEGLLQFYYQKPFPEEKKFPYIKLTSLIKKFEENNGIANLVSTNIDSKAQSDNKKQYIENAETLRTQIAEFLNEIESFYKEEGIVLTEYS